MRRTFTLPEEDRAYLDTRGLLWETIIDGSQWLLVHDYPIGQGYNHPAATAALLIAPTYPDAKIDMVYFHPHLARIDGKPIPNLSNQPIDGRPFQRWSRHRTDDDQSRLGVDGVGTHFLLVDEWLRREFRVR